MLSGLTLSIESYWVNALQLLIIWLWMKENCCHVEIQSWKWSIQVQALCAVWKLITRNARMWLNQLSCQDMNWPTQITKYLQSSTYSVLVKYLSVLDLLYPVIDQFAHDICKRNQHRKHICKYNSSRVLNVAAYANHCRFRQRI